MPIIGDEDIISARIAAENDASIYKLSSAMISRDMYQFERREFPPYFSIVIPESFDELAPEYAKIKFPYEERPSIIMSNNDTTVNIVFDCMTVQPESLQERLDKYQAVIKKIHPNYVFFSNGIYNLNNDSNLAYYDYRGNALDADIYYICFFTDLPSGELFGCFSCPSESQSDWEPYARKMIQTIEQLIPDSDNNGR